MRTGIVTYLFFTVVFISCRKENSLDCFTSNGREVTQVRYPGNFSSLVVHDKFDVTIRRGQEYKVEISAGGNLLRNISSRIEHDTLIVENRNTCNFVRGYKRELKVVVTAPYIRYAKNNSVGTMRFDHEFAQDTIVVRAENSGDIHVNGKFNEVRTSSHGNGDVYLSGSCNSLYIYTYGLNYVRAENLEVTDFAFVDTYTLGDCYINAVKLRWLAYHIARDGNIYYKGDPQELSNYSKGEAKGRAIRY